MVKPLPNNRLREAENLGRKKESGFHPCVYPRACKIIIFISLGHNAKEKIGDALGSVPRGEGL